MYTVNKIAGIIMLICGWSFMILLMVGCGLHNESKGKDIILTISWYLRWLLLLSGVAFLITWFFVLP